MKQKKLSKTFFVPKNNYEQASLDVYNLLVENFSETFFVGGMVRNLLINKKISDVDIATMARPNQVSKLLTVHGISHDISAQKFGVITIRHKNRTIEITTFRKEIYTKTRYPKVTFSKSLRVDSQRRDFTVNSLYFHAKNHYLMDFQNGLEDLRHLQLRTIGDPNTKFQEDPLRIVRAFRFQKQYQFHFETQTQQAIQNNLHLVKTLSQTKIKTEINKINSQTIKNFLIKKFS